MFKLLLATTIGACTLVVQGFTPDNSPTVIKGMIYGITNREDLEEI